MHRTEKAGLGAAYLHGFAVALERGYDVIGEMDADGSHQPEQLPRLLDGAVRRRPGDRLPLGARAASVVNWPLTARRSRSAATSTPGWLLGIPVRDVTAGFRLFRRTTLETIDLGDGGVGRATASRPTWRGAPSQAGLRVVEVPIEFVERERGESKMNRAVADRVAAPDHPVGARGAAPPGCATYSRR